MSSIPPALPERWPYPEYWVAKGSDLALPTKVGTNRANWDLRYDDPPAFNLDLENQMNVAPGGFVTPGPHGPQVIPGVYTLKLIVDGQTYTQTRDRSQRSARRRKRQGHGRSARQEQTHVVGVRRAKNSYDRKFRSVGHPPADGVAEAPASFPPMWPRRQRTFNTKLATFGGIVAGRGGTRRRRRWWRTRSRRRTRSGRDHSVQRTERQLSIPSSACRRSVWMKRRRRQKLTPGKTAARNTTPPLRNGKRCSRTIWLTSMRCSPRTI